MALTKAKSNWYNNLSDFDLVDDFTQATISNILYKIIEMGLFKQIPGQLMGRAYTTQKHIPQQMEQAVSLAQTLMFSRNSRDYLLRPICG